MTTHELLEKTKSVSKQLAMISNEDKNAVLNEMANSLLENTQIILDNNAIDVENAKNNVSSVMIDRLTLNETRIKAMADGIKEITKLPNPVGRILKETERPNGLKLIKKSIPFGVIAIIYESRPNVTSDAVALCIKSGNACVLRCGKEAHLTCSAIVNALKNGLKKANVNEDFINLVEDTSRQSANELMTSNGLVDLLIPRGGYGLIKACTENATVPCIHTGTGICHIYVDEYADLDKAIKIIVNAKTSRPSVCNAEEVCLVNTKIANKFLPMLKKALVDDRINNGLNPVELRLCEKSYKIIDGIKANENDFDTEFLDYILAVKLVENVDEAITHISLHSTQHSEAIITENSVNANKFTDYVDSSSVYVNASTRFTDGGEFGFGCEMGISTQKLHARGPMGLEELTTYKYIIIGNGQIR